MTAIPPSPSGDSSIPPRHRPIMGNFTRETTELDLWALDDLDAEQGVSAKPGPKVHQSVIPVPRDYRRRAEPSEAAIEPTATPSAPAESENSDQPEGTPVRSKFQPVRPLASASQLPDHFAELDDTAPPTSAAPAPAESAPATPDPSPSVNVAAPAEPAAPAAPPVPRIPSAEDDEFSPRPREGAVPLDLRPRLGLSLVERIGLVALVLLVVVGGGTFFYSRLSRLAPKSSVTDENDFPIKGQYTTVRSAETYWRAPILSGAMAETVRPGTKMIPVIKISTQGGTAGVRVLFRDSDGLLIGDAITQATNPNIPLEITATAGFTDVGMFSGYRAEQGKPWTVEVTEAPAENAANSDFKKLFKLAISTAQR
ncbi:MAG: hypothetical protein QE267_05285 [Akkermansiaceae bacterium]|nr:hypothetical protein [Akkermansiaceae bacterium]